MNSVRFFYQKKGRIRFTSHLDMVRVMTRAVRQAALPVEYTQGYHPHPYITFALPLSLGFESEYEIMDTKLGAEATDAPQDVLRRLNAALPEGICFFRMAAPVQKASAVAFADFSVFLRLPQGLCVQTLSDFFKQPVIEVEKTNKRGVKATLDIKPRIRRYAAELQDGQICRLMLRLAAGGAENVNPRLIFEAFSNDAGTQLEPLRVVRTMLYDAEGKPFV